MLVSVSRRWRSAFLLQLSHRCRPSTSLRAGSGLTKTAAPRLSFCARLMLLLVTSLSVASFAADLKVKVVDPQSAVVAGARVTVYPRDSSIAVAVRTTNAEGTCAFSGLSASAYPR